MNKSWKKHDLSTYRWKRDAKRDAKRIRSWLSRRGVEVQVILMEAHYEILYRLPNAIYIGHTEPFRADLLSYLETQADDITPIHRGDENVNPHSGNIYIPFKPGT